MEKYLASVVSGLRSSPGNTDLTRAKVFKLYLCQNDEKKGDLFQISGILGTVNTFNTEGCSETGPAMHLSNNVYWSKLCRKYLSYKAQVFFENVQSLM